MPDDLRRQFRRRFRTVLRGAEGLPPGKYQVQIAAVLPSVGPDGVGQTAVLDVVGRNDTPQPVAPMRKLETDDEETP